MPTLTELVHTLPKVNKWNDEAKWRDGPSPLKNLSGNPRQNNSMLKLSLANEYLNKNFGNIKANLNDT